MRHSKRSEKCGSKKICMTVAEGVVKQYRFGVKVSNKSLSKRVSCC